MAKNETSEIKISKDLQNLVKKNTKITEVYFDAEGNHYFTHYPETKVFIQDEMGYVDPKKKNQTKTVDALPGSTYGVFRLMDNSGKNWKAVRKIIDAKEVATMMTREQILKANAVEILPGEEEQNKILDLAKKIVADRNAKLEVGK